MRNQYALESYSTGFGNRLAALNLTVPRRAIVGAILMIALFAFELFNFDTTRYALGNLMGDVKFLGFQWAAILAIAFCSIDFAGLVRLFTPEKGKDEPKEVWYLMGAWLLGATMNALMTWWAVSLTLLNHEFGNEVMSREQLLDVVPVFVAVLVWLTRILFIGAFSVAGEHIFDVSNRSVPRTSSAKARASNATTDRSASRPSSRRRRHAVKEGTPQTNRGQTRSPQRSGTSRRTPASGSSSQNGPSRPNYQRNSRIRQRPPVPKGMKRMPLNGVQARPKIQN